MREIIVLNEANDYFQRTMLPDISARINMLLQQIAAADTQNTELVHKNNQLEVAVGDLLKGCAS